MTALATHRWSPGTSARRETSAVVMLPSLGRSGTDFEDLGGRLAAAGYEAVAVDLHGVGGSPLPSEDATLHDLAGDVAAVVGSVGSAPVHVLGHAFGNRVARCLAADRPDLARSVTLLAAGGKVAPPPEVRQAVVRCVDMSLPEAERRRAVSTAMFAPGNDPAAWLDGWWADAARAQSGAGARTPVDEWWTAGSAPVLVVQGRQDAVAPPENGRMLVAELGDRARLVELDGAGHALLPERPGDVAEAVLAFLEDLDQENRQ